VSGDQDLGQVERFRSVILERLGLRFDDGKLGDLAELLARRAEETSCDRSTYLAGLQSKVAMPATAAGSAELRALARELTVNETYFFRNAEHLRALAEVALPDCGRTYPSRRPLKILSAGCASGEEAYSLAILARDSLEPAGLPISIHGIDVNPAMIERAARARYSTWALRETPAPIQARYFRANGREMILDEELRKTVSFEERNLVDDDHAFWRPEIFDVIFCRNVLMYFAPEKAQVVMARLSRSLVPGGYLFLGYAETMRGLSQDFHLRHTHGGFYYQRRDARSAVAVSVERGAIGGRDAREPALDARSYGVSLPAGDVSWVETIRHASERVTQLTSGRASARTSGAEGRAKIAFDVSPAVELLRQERFGEAQALLADLPPDAAKDADVLLLRAVLLTHGGNLAQAETLCRDVIALDEMSAGAHYLTALCREDAGDRSAAAEHDRIAAYLDPTFAMPRLHLGLLARRAGDQPTARRELGEAMTLLEREDPSRLLLYGGGFGRPGLAALCRAELRACGGPP
jgi:chemotaxis protein methyltransferase CheR